MGRQFEKISLRQFAKDIKDDKVLYDSYNIPVRKTKNSAGYDFEAILDFTIKPRESFKIPTGIKFYCEEDEFLMLTVRSSQGYKYNIRMCNQVGIIDSDYYNNEENEGHIWIKLQNEGENNYTVKKGDAICQGIFLNYLIIDTEKEILKTRTGGLGSTTKEEK